ncbi:MAG: hypothetical protein A2648_02605 [Candidatus Lloydbacteria bacterium RIFCSPHIGHO2_01_FULL_41_20]|uniref:DUF8128 domain-containing protein n=1 Tax=Candidatus Lloydbacteria bacterium RIFCSPHIGHO2_01_FULL_41_20 TaxID=1798657 RepID=A0A1G2CT32_9BACT|nr:MAG: hypothetical protein A2648_02605 [Candidatus Lloydbacteria bacterium RIFCSPHIGHO2_01_FULL_41_20]
MAIFDFFFGSFVGAFEAAYYQVTYGATALIVPLALIFFAWKIWVYYINAEYLNNLKWALLEVRLPKEIRRSPLAMEIVLNSFHQTGKTGSPYKKYWLGQLRPTFSLEIVSIGGMVHFFIYTMQEFRNAVESYIYAQYPEAEIVEAPDYAEMVSYTIDGRWSMNAIEFVLSKPDPYPIKTYIDYGMDKSAKEEERIDPITPTIELMGSLKKGEQLWLQIIVRAAMNRYKLPGKWFKHGSYKDEAEEEIKKIKALATDAEGRFNTNLLTPVQKSTIESLERNTDKLGFDAGIRAIYIAEKDPSRGASSANIPALVNMMKQYNSANLNGFTISRLTSFDNYPWSEYLGLKRGEFPYINIGIKESEKEKLKGFGFYRNRSYFYQPCSHKPFVLSSEELATIYHFPGGVSGTPSFARIDSKKSEPPINLPV